ncbi:hypothetical protein EYF80_059738 [Liparis tanakae]|uniref:Uncharacterized protein n=1 Tax=Liparis tanakae TaxID=230148 RepID=A0A4Z2ENG6_9TELE|nr:hypothetical protein EYF80_059738 [Liparis tanakae]
MDRGKCSGGQRAVVALAVREDLVGTAASGASRATLIHVGSASFMADTANSEASTDFTSNTVSAHIISV